MPSEILLAISWLVPFALFLSAERARHRVTMEFIDQRADLVRIMIAARNGDKQEMERLARVLGERSCKYRPYWSKKNYE